MNISIIANNLGKFNRNLNNKRLIEIANDCIALNITEDSTNLGKLVIN